MNFFKPLFFLNIVLFCRISILLLMLLSINGYTQEGIVFEFGQNTSNYSHKTEVPPLDFYSQTGQELRISYIRSLLSDHEISFGLSFFEANSKGKVITTNLDYQTKFLGAFVKTHFNFLTLFNRRFCTSCTKINFFATVGAQTSILSQGTQKINEQVIDLSGKEDFKGLWVAPMLGINSRFDASELISLFISYEFMPMFNVTDNEEDFKIRQNPLTLGIRLWL